MAAKWRGLTDIVMSGLLPVLCAGLIVWSSPAAAKNDEQDNRINAPGNLQ